MVGLPSVTRLTEVQQLKRSGQSWQEKEKKEQKLPIASPAQTKKQKRAQSQGEKVKL
jgi:hypothetical protein